MLSSLAVLAMASFLASEPPVPEAVKAEVRRFRELQWREVPTKAGIDAEVMAAVLARLGSGKGFSDRGEPFNADEFWDGRPSRRLVLAGQSGPWWFVCFEHGGLGHGLGFAMFDTRAGDARLVLIAFGSAGDPLSPGGWKASVSDLKRALGNGRLRAQPPHD